MAERFFGAADVGSLATVAEPSIYFSSPKRLDPYFNIAGHTVGGDTVWQIAVPIVDQVESGLAINEGGVALAAAGEGSAQTALALAFAEHLAKYRRQRIAEVAGSAVVSKEIRETSEGIVRIPHLMAHSLLGELEDVSMWEFMPKDKAETWNDGPLPDQRFFEDHLPGLLQLRADIRVGRVPEELSGHIQAGGYVSMRFVYQNHELFRKLLTV